MKYFFIFLLPKFHLFMTKSVNYLPLDTYPEFSFCPDRATPIIRSALAAVSYTFSSEFPCVGSLNILSLKLAPPHSHRRVLFSSPMSCIALRQRRWEWPRFTSIPWSWSRWPPSGFLWLFRFTVANIPVSKRALPFPSHQQNCNCYTWADEDCFLMGGSMK